MSVVDSTILWPSCIAVESVTSLGGRHFADDTTTECCDVRSAVVTMFLHIKFSFMCLHNLTDQTCLPLSKIEPGCYALAALRRADLCKPPLHILTLKLLHISEMQSTCGLFAKTCNTRRPMSAFDDITRLVVFCYPLMFDKSQHDRLSLRKCLAYTCLLIADETTVQ